MTKIDATHDWLFTEIPCVTCGKSVHVPREYGDVRAAKHGDCPSPS